MPVGKVRQYPYFLRLFHTSTPLRSVELSMKKESMDLVASTGHLWSEPSIVKFIENQSEHFSKLTIYHLKKRATRRSRCAREPSRIPLLFLRGLNKKNSMLKKFVFKKISTIDIPKSSKLHRYDFIMHDINVITNAIQR